MPYEIYLAHHGVSGQKWGVRHGPPYPLSKGRVIKKKIKKIDESLTKTAKALNNKIQKKKEEYHKKEVENIINSGDKKLVLKNQKKLTTAELKAANDRLIILNEIKKGNSINESSFKITADKINETVKTLVNYTGTALNLYDNYAKVKKIYDGAKKKKVEAEKNKVISSGNVETILAHKGSLSNAELKSAYERVKNEHQLKSGDFSDDKKKDK